MVQKSKALHCNAIWYHSREVIASQLQTDNPEDEIENYKAELDKTWLMPELHQARNFSPLLKKFGLMLGSPLVWIDQNILRGRLPFTLSAASKDHDQLKELSNAEPITYEKYDNVITFDRTSSIYLSGVNHEEDQPCHLKLTNSEIPISTNLPFMESQQDCIAQLGFMKSFKAVMASLISRSMPKTAFIAKLVTLKIPVKISIGSAQKGLEAPIILICSYFFS